ncbi:MAG: hypothetical protein IGS50_23720 [Synechococcales cyanobacterium C42_A2020_086]|nr:hypothetical protein [Synechococcales cyanobacterium C42_A2020_086]
MAISTLLTSPPAAQAQTRTCSSYGVVRDRSDYEVPLLPRRSVSRCARSYQTLYQTYRVRAVPRSIGGRSATPSSAN